MEENSVTSLVTAAREGNKVAFSTLIQRYEPAAGRFAVHLTGDKEWAEELVQEATLQAYLSLAHLRSPQHFKSWFCGIILNIHRSNIRERHNSVSLEEVKGDFQTGITYENDTPSSITEETEQRTILLKTIGQLSQEYREVLQLFYFRGLTVSEIASAIAIPETTIKVRLHRARLKLKDILQSSYPEISPVRRKDMIAVSIADISKQERKDAEGRPYTMYVVLLLDKTGRRVLPIWIGASEGQAIATGMHKLTAPRPLTLDFYVSLLKAVGTRVIEVRVETLKDNTFYGIVKVTRGRTTKEVDARPSDALALAVRTGSPIFVAEEVMDRAGIAVKVEVPPTQAGVDAISKEAGDTYKRWYSTLHPFPSQEDIEAINNLLSDVFKS
jgi:RNA polymerase sigma factor (sigma-70 family)